MPGAIDRLVVESFFDPTGIRAGLQQSVTEVRNFATAVRATDPFAGLGKAAQFALTQLNDKLVAGTTTTLATLRAEFDKGLIDQRRFEREGTAAIAALEKGLRAGTASLAAQGIIPVEATDRAVIAARRAGLEAGKAFRFELEETVRQSKIVLPAPVLPPVPALPSGLQQGPLLSSGRFFPAVPTTTIQSVSWFNSLVNQTTGELTALGRRGTPAVTALAFGLEGLARGSATGESGLRAAARSASAFSFALGPEVGLAVVAGSAALNVMIDLWQQSSTASTKAAKDASDAAAAFKHSIADIINTGGRDFDLTAQVAQLEKGLRSAGKSALGAFNTGGILDLEAQRRPLQNTLDNFLAGGASKAAEPVIALRKQLEALDAILKPKQTQRDELTKAIRDLQDEQKAFTPAATTVTAPRVKLERVKLEKFGLDKITPELVGARESVDALIVRLTALNTLSLRPSVDPDFLRTLREVQAQYDATTAAILIQASHGRVNTDLLREQARLATTIADEAKRAADQTARFTTAPLIPVITPDLPHAGSGVIPPRTAKDLSDTLQQIHGFETAARGALQVADAIGAIGQSARRELDGLISLGSSLFQINALSKAGKSLSSGEGLGAVVGIFSGAVSILSTLFRPSQRSIEHAQILQQNNDALKGVQLALQGFHVTIGNANAARRATEDFSTNGTLARLALIGITAFVDNPAAKQAALLTESLKPFGLTIDQLNAIAKQFGITLQDSRGNLIIESFAALDLAIKAAEFSFAHFTSTVTGFRDDFERGLALTGTPIGDADRLRESEAIFTRFAPNLGHLFDGLDASSKEGRAKIRAVYQGIYDDFKAGRLDLTSLGFENAQDFFSAFDLGISSLNGFDAAIKSVTDSLLFVPQGFKVQRAIFDATIADVRQPPTARPLLGTTRTGGPVQTDSGPGGRTRPDGPTFSVGNVYIDGAGKDGEQIWKEVKDAARTESLRRFGTTTRASDTLN